MIKKKFSKTIHIILIILGGVLFVLFGSKTVQAQITSSAIAIPLPISVNVTDGDIICATEEGNVPCDEEFSTAMTGIYSASPAAEIIDLELLDSKPVVTSGVTRVRVSTLNGAIEENDFITSSTIPGVGVLAKQNGYILGSALEAYDNQNPEEIGTIAVAVNIHPAIGISSTGSNLIQFIREGIAVPLYGPLESLRYLLAVLIVLISFVLGLLYFGRVSRSGVEAIGRNPLAHKVIQVTIFLHVLLSIVIIGVGLVIAYLVLIL